MVVMNSDVEETFLAEIAVALRATGLEALVVGNVASILNGAPVLTRDVDLLVRKTPLNQRKLKKLAASLGGTGPLPISDLTSTERIYGLRVPIDILYDQIAGKLRFAALRSRAQPVPVGGGVLTVASLADVIKSKEAAGRPKDKAVLPILRDTLAVRRAQGLP